MLLPLWESVIVLCFVVRYFMSILVLQSSEMVDLLNLLNLSGSRDSLGKTTWVN